MNKDLSISKLNDVYGSLLTAKQNELIKQFYDDDLSLGEIAENEGITRQAAHDTINKGVVALKKYESELMLSEILDKLKCIDSSMSKADILKEIDNIINLRE